MRGTPVARLAALALLLAPRHPRRQPEGLAWCLMRSGASNCVSCVASGGGEALGISAIHRLAGGQKARLKWLPREEIPLLVRSCATLDKTIISVQARA